MKSTHSLKPNETRTTIKFTRVLIWVVMLVLFTIPCVVLADDGLSIKIECPDSIGRDESGNLSPNPFEVTVTITNDTGIEITGATATLALGKGLGLAPGESLEKNIEVPGTGVETKISWKVKAIDKPPYGERKVSIAFTVIGIKPIFIPVKVPPPNGNHKLTVLIIPPPTELGRDLNGKLSPNPFSIFVIVTNDGKKSANDVKATLESDKGLNLESGENEYMQSVEEIPPGGKTEKNWQINAIDEPPYGQRSLTVKVRCKNKVVFENSYLVKIPRMPLVSHQLNITSPIINGKKTIILTIKVSEVTNLDTAHLTLNFDKEVLSIDDVTTGELNPEGEPVRINNDGVITIQMDLPEDKGVSGSGSILQIMFKVIDELQYSRSIQLLDLSLGDTFGKKIPASVASFVFEIK